MFQIRPKKAYTMVEILIVVSIITVLLAVLFLISMRRAGSMKNKIDDVNSLRLQEKRKVNLQVEVDSELQNFRNAMEVQRAKKLIQDNPVNPAVYRISKGVNYSGNTDGKTNQLVQKLLATATKKIKSGQIKEAVQLLKEANTIATFDPNTSLEIAKLFLHSDHLDYAKASIDNAITLDPEYAEAHLFKARLLIKSNQLDLAKQSIVHTENLKHKNADIMLVWSEYYSKIGNKHESKLYLDKYKFLLGKDKN
ncbi:MAG: prepilin-type N-terminal cleavage/methylation domain-containing protein [Candidatus Cloacimonetes bacterium]|nr:prepilin-type N-terminal cleavage/methylation domain-containing protein [Candidatus Cloacimonadota bacterium]